jgi:hypothetical protein
LSGAFRKAGDHLSDDAVRARLASEQTPLVVTDLIPGNVKFDNVNVARRAAGRTRSLAAIRSAASTSAESSSRPRLASVGI